MKKGFLKFAMTLSALSAGLVAINELHPSTVSAATMSDGLHYIYREWHFYRNGKIDWDYRGLVQYNNQWFFVENGKVQWGANTLAQVNNEGVWYKVTNGAVDWGFTGLEEYNGTMYYIQSGRLNWEVDGLTNINGTWYNLRNSSVQRNGETLAYYNNTWFYVNNGQVVWDKNTLVLFNGTWYAVRDSKVDWSFTGLVDYNYKKYYIQNGQLTWGIDGLVQIDGTWYYLQNSALSQEYNSLVEYNGSRYYVQKGILYWGVDGKVFVNGEPVWLENSRQVANKKETPSEPNYSYKTVTRQIVFNYPSWEEEDYRYEVGTRFIKQAGSDGLGEQDYEQVYIDGVFQYEIKKGEPRTIVEPVGQITTVGKKPKAFTDDELIEKLQQYKNENQDWLYQQLLKAESDQTVRREMNGFETDTVRWNEQLSSRVIQWIEANFDQRLYNQYMVEFINADRQAKGIPPIEFSPDLLKMANIRAKEQAQVGTIINENNGVYTTHSRPDGRGYGTVENEVMKADPTFYLSGENLLEDPRNIVASFVNMKYLAYMDFQLWKSSTQGHYEAMMNRDHKYVATIPAYYGGLTGNFESTMRISVQLFGDKFEY